MKDWEVFQHDVLDVLRQYEGYFNFFERVGSLSDDSRPDCFARISREDKKEIWVIDAKNKPEIGEGDRERMEKYMSMLRSNPIDVGLDIGELSDYTIRGIFVTANGVPELQDYEAVKFKAFHQFLQRELVYTDTDRVVRDISKMVERKQLSQSQARLLFRSVKPFEQRLNRAIEVLERIETEYIGLEVKKPPLSRFDFEVPVDAVVTHKNRDKAFLFDIPYSWDAVRNVDNKVGEVKKRLEDMEKEVYYTAINTFQSHDSKYVLQPEEVEKEIMETAGILSPERVAKLFTPKIPTEKEYSDNSIQIRSKQGFDFRLEVRTTDDVNHTVEAVLPKKAISQIKDSSMNSRKTVGEFRGRKLRHELEVSEDFSIRYHGNREPFSSYRDSINSIYSKSVNPVLSKKINAV